MNPTIKARIESIRRGEVPEGYKRTKIGIVPNEWGISKIGSVSERIIPGATPSTSVKKYWDGNIRWMSSGEIHNRFIYNTKSNITKEGYEVCSTMILPTHCVLIALAGQGKTRGCVAVNEVELCTNQSIAALVPKDIYYLYLFFYLESKYLELRKISSGDGTRGGLNISLLNGFQIAIPAHPEQEKIAEILAGQDRVIALKEKLLAEKQKQKKYLMQQLFMHDIKKWIRLSEIANVIMGQSPDSKYYNDKMIGLPLLQGNADLKDGYPLPRIYTTSVTKKCEKNDILLSVRAPVGCVFRSNIVACIGRGISAIRSRELQEYLYHFLIFYEEKWKSVAQGSTFEAISGNDIRNLLIPIVVDKEKVCKVLSTADKEIELLKKDIEQEKLKKKSLMQLLLTGIVRVDELVS